MPLYQLQHQALNEPIPPGDYLYDPPSGLPRITVRLEREATAEELAEAIREKWGSNERVAP